MFLASLFERCSDISQMAVYFAAYWLLQSASLIAAGLIAGGMLRGKGAAMQSAIYRVTLAAAILCPAVSLLFQTTGIHGIALNLPLPHGFIKPSEVKSDHAIVDQMQSNSSRLHKNDVLMTNSLAQEGPSFTSASVIYLPISVAKTKLQESSNTSALTQYLSSLNWSKVIPCGLMAAWLLISCILIIRLLVAWRQAAYLKRTACPADARTIRDCQILAARMGVRVPAVLRSPFVASPLLVGLSRPAILLPEEGAQSETRCREILTHELAHLVRLDGFWNLLGRIGTAILFFQPFLWLLVRRLGVSAEEVCDDYVVHYGFDRPAYARWLVEIAEQYQPIHAVSLGVISLRSFVGRRIVRILDSSRRLSIRLDRRAMLSVAATSIAITCLVASLTLGGNQIAAGAVDDVTGLAIADNVDNFTNIASDDKDNDAMEDLSDDKDDDNTGLAQEDKVADIPELAFNDAAGQASNEKSEDAAGQKPEEYRLEGQNAAVYNIAGNIEIVPGSGTAIVVEVRRGGKDAEQLKVAVGDINGRQTLRVIYSGDRIVYNRKGGGNYNSTVPVHEDGTFDGKKQEGTRELHVSNKGPGLDAHADLKIIVPAKRDIFARLAFGKISARDLEANLKLNANSADVDASRIKGTLDIGTGSGDVSAGDVQGTLIIGTGSGDVSSSKVQGTTKITTGSGDIKSSDIHADGIKMNTGSGDVLLQRVQGALTIDTGSGDVKGGDIRADEINMKTGSGDIHLSVVQSPKIDLNCAKGDVDLDLTSNADSVVVNAVSGDVIVRATDELGAKVDLKTVSGEINGKLTVKMDNQNDQNAKQAHKKSHMPNIVRGTVGNGSGSLKINTVSGDIQLIPRGDSKK